MAADKRYTDLPAATVLNTDNVLAMVDVDGNVSYQFTLAQLLAFFGTNASVGAAISFGTGAIPSNSLGNDGDVYVKTDTGQFAQKLSGAWTVVYTIVQGVVGSTVYYGSTTPASGLGINGDTYIQTAAGIFYTKISGTWTAEFTMATGPVGPRGTSVLNGTTDPSSGTGNDGDFYLNTTSTTLFGPKAAGAWPGSGIKLTGTNGNTILNGNHNPSNTDDGVNGDFYINTVTNNIFGPKAAGAWPAGISVIGPEGPTGPAGTAFDMTAYIEAAPTLVDEDAAITAGLAPYTFYKTPTGELRYKLVNLDFLTDSDGDLLTTDGNFITI